MKKIFAILAFTFLGITGSAAAGTFYDSPNLSTATGRANMGLVGEFDFFASTLTGGKNTPPLRIGTTIGIYAPGNLGIEMATVTARTWLRASSVTVTGYGIIATHFYGDGSGLTNLSTGGVIDAAAVITATTTLFNQLNSTAVYVSRLWASSVSTYNALVSTGVALSRFQTAINISTAQISVATSTLYQQQISSAVSLSRNWESTISTWNALVATGTALTQYQHSANSTMTVLSNSTTTLRLATATLQGITTELTVSTTTLGLSTATLKARLDSFIVTGASVQTRIDQLQVFASTGQQVNRALGISTATIRASIANGVVAMYDSAGTFLGNVTTIKLGANLIASVNGVSGATGTIVAVTTTPTNSGIFRIYTIVDSDTSTQVQVSTINLMSNEFTREVGGIDSGSQTWRISNATHVFTANQGFSSATASLMTVFGNFIGGGNGTFSGIVSGANLSAIRLTTYPVVGLLDGNQTWQMTTRNLNGGIYNRMFVITDASNAQERFQIELSSGLLAVGGDKTGGLNANTFPPGSAKFTVHGGSLAVVGADAFAFVRGLIQSTSGFIFPDGSIQTAALNFGSSNTWTGQNTFDNRVKVSSTLWITGTDSDQLLITRSNQNIHLYNGSGDSLMEFNGMTNGHTFRLDGNSALFLSNTGNVQIGDVQGATQRLRVSHGNVEAADGGVQGSTTTIFGVTTDPAVGSATQGRLAYRSDTGKLRFSANGAAYQNVLVGNSVLPSTADFTTIGVSSIIVSGLATPPSFTTQNNGLIIYNTTLGELQFVNHGQTPGWVAFSSMVVNGTGVIVSSMTSGLLKNVSDSFTGQLNVSTSGAGSQPLVINNSGAGTAAISFRVSGTEYGTVYAAPSANRLGLSLSAASTEMDINGYDPLASALTINSFQYTLWRNSNGDDVFAVRGGSIVLNGGTVPTSMFDMHGGSATIRGPNAALMVAGGTVTAQGILASSVTVTRGGAIVFGDGSRMTTAASGTGGSSGVSTTSGTITLEASGDVFLSTNPMVNGTAYWNWTSTFNITSVSAYQLISSTVPIYQSTFAVVISTVVTGAGITWTGIDDSSWTVRVGSGISADNHAPTCTLCASNTRRILPMRVLYMFQTGDPVTNGGGTPPGGVWGIKLYGWWEN
jgi:hypothetical protein